jgi:hypothetical protein
MEVVICAFTVIEAVHALTNKARLKWPSVHAIRPSARP